MEHPLSILEQRPAEKRPFLRRQFAPTPTRAQMVFDVIFGVAGPILCFIADPLVFKSGLMGPALLGQFQLFAYVFSAIAISMLIVWFCLEDYLDAFALVVSGTLVAGAAFSLVIGIIILPFTLLGLIFIIGLAGFTPFLTALVYLRNAFRAFPSHKNGQSRELIWIAAAVSGLVAMVLPAVFSYQVSMSISRSTNEILYGSPKRAEVLAEQMKWVPFLPKESFDEIVRVYGQEQDARKRANLKKFYEDVTGFEIEQRLRILND